MRKTIVGILRPLQQLVAVVVWNGERGRGIVTRRREEHTRLNVERLLRHHHCLVEPGLVGLGRERIERHVVRCLVPVGAPLDGEPAGRRGDVHHHVAAVLAERWANGKVHHERSRRLGDGVLSEEDFDVIPFEHAEGEREGVLHAVGDVLNSR
ncbi:MAG: hypothetical protein IIB19_00545 [Chloroflexi bacterium]|nr:hypothetical protein [Chloroflexota bacterium]